ncbi:hypothetical protein EI94DRAFT_1707417 [Lactarius quietus]|nr:hypothetical protein EI94DRAFT_1707417 [Lactarius quietus]
MSCSIFASNRLTSHGTAPNVVTEDLEEPTPGEDHTNYPNIIYWYKHEQLAERRRHEQDRLLNGALAANHRANENVMFWFLQHSDSRVLDGSEVRKIHAKAKSQWLALCKKYGDVGSPWTNVSPNYQLEFFVKMEHKFPLLRLCDGHYKTEAVAFADYSHWHSKNKFEYTCRSKTTTMSHSKTNTQTTSKSESDTDADSEGKEDKEVDELMEDGEVTGGIDANHALTSSVRCNLPRSMSSIQSSVKPKPRPTYAGAPNAVAPQATPTEVTPPEATLSTAMPLRATTPGQITVTSEVMQASAKATNETHKQQELDAKGAAKLSLV